MRRGEMRGLGLQPVYDDFNPQVEWVQEPFGYILRLCLPQVFRKEDLNIIYDQNGKITVRGRRLVGVNRFARFESSYNLPKDSNLEKIRGKLENNILSLTIPKIAISKPSEKKKEEPVMVEKPTMVAEERKGDEATAPKEKPTLAEKERKERVDQKMKEEPIQKITTMEEKKEEPTLKEKPKMVREEMKEEKTPEVIIETATVSKEKAMMAEDERKLDSAAVLKEMIEEARKIEMATGVRIKESAALKELHEKLQSMKEPNIEDRKDEAVPNEVKKEEPTVKEKLKNLEEKNEAIQKDKLEGSDREKKEESTRTEDTWEHAVKGESRYGHETEVQEKQPKEKDSRKRIWFWNEEDKDWLDWLDGAFIEEALQKIYRNKMCITLALVAFSTGYYISRKSRTRG